MNKIYVILGTLLLIIMPFATYAWPGCCSHHGGVCGCKCCDGTPLSSTCLPHYPECSAPTYTPPKTYEYEPVSTPTAPLEPVIVPDITRDKYVTVSRIVDGDTIEINTGEKVRLIGIDTPESVHPEKPVECFAKEASEYLETLIDGKSVELKKDRETDDKDKYGRLLRYVFIGDTDYNAKMVADGYAYAYTEFRFTQSEEYKELEANAKNNKLGLWADDACVESDYEEETENIVVEKQDLDTIPFNNSSSDNEDDKEITDNEKETSPLGMLLAWIGIIGALIGIPLLRDYIVKKRNK